MVNTEALTDLKSCRVARDLTQEKLAGQLGVSLSAVRHWESGIRMPGGPARRQLSQVLDAPLDVVDSWFPVAPSPEPALAAAEG